MTFKSVVDAFIDAVKMNAHNAIKLTLLEFNIITFSTFRDVLIFIRSIVARIEETDRFLKNIFENNWIVSFGRFFSLRSLSFSRRIKIRSQNALQEKKRFKAFCRN